MLLGGELQIEAKKKKKNQNQNQNQILAFLRAFFTWNLGARLQSEAL